MLSIELQFLELTLKSFQIRQVHLVWQKSKIHLNSCRENFDRCLIIFILWIANYDIWPKAKFLKLYHKTHICHFLILPPKTFAGKFWYRIRRKWEIEFLKEKLSKSSVTQWKEFQISFKKWRFEIFGYNSWSTLDFNFA